MAEAKQKGRHFTVAIFVVEDGRVILMRHPRLGIWLPPGGHIEENELPDEAAIREVREETGIEVRLLGEKGPSLGVLPQTRPAGIQVEPIEPGHEHIDLIYYAIPTDGVNQALKCEAGTRGLGWYSLDEAVRMGANEEVLTWIRGALAEAEGQKKRL